MSKSCPIKGVAISEDCKECTSKECKKAMKYKTICIGIDQSYGNTGISLCADGVLKKVKSIQLLNYKNHTEQRKAIQKELDKVCKACLPIAEKVVCVIERIRLFSQGFVNINYIKSIGALDATIKDKMYEYDIPVFSVDTRCWKASVIGTSKGKSNKYGVPEEKWPTVLWLLKKGFEDSILIEVPGRKTKGTFERNGVKYMYNNDAADSAAIASFWFIGDNDKLEEVK